MYFYFEQADVVLAHYRTCAPAKSVHFNFMARGKALSNPHLLSGADNILDGLWRRAKEVDLRALLGLNDHAQRLRRPAGRCLRPLPTRAVLLTLFDGRRVRRRWLPNAQPAALALDHLVDWQRQSYKLVKIHFAFIEGENDSEADVHAALEQRGLFAHINIVRYNPPSPKHGQESAPDVLERNVALFRSRLGGARVQVVPRVGFDVYASCGMFVEAPHLAR